MNNQEINIKEAILRKIKAGEVHMYSDAYFMLKLVALAAVVALALLVSIGIFNFILFSARVSGHNALLGFGARGFLEFLELFPWPLFAIDVVLIVLAEWLLRQFRFGYRIPILYLLAGLILATSIVGLILDRATPFNDRLLERADERGLPGPLNGIYEHARRPRPPEGGMCRCMITSIGTSSLTAFNADLGSSSPLTIELGPGLAQATTSLSLGEIIFVAGDRDGTVIRAFGLSTRPPPPPPSEHDRDRLRTPTQ